MGLIQRNVDGAPIEGLYLHLYCLILVDSSFVGYPPVRAEILRFARLVEQDQDLDLMTRIACSYPSAINSGDVSFCRASRFRFGVPAVEESSLGVSSLGSAMEVLERASSEVDAFDGICSVPVLAIVSENRELESITKSIAASLPVMMSFKSASLHDFFRALLGNANRAVSGGLVR